jgi:hypothetical protein
MDSVGSKARVGGIVENAPIEVSGSSGGGGGRIRGRGRGLVADHSEPL